MGTYDGRSNDGGRGVDKREILDDVGDAMVVTLPGSLVEARLRRLAEALEVDVKAEGAAGPAPGTSKREVLEALRHIRDVSPEGGVSSDMLGELIHDLSGGAGSAPEAGPIRGADPAFRHVQEEVWLASERERESLRAEVDQLKAELSGMAEEVQRQDRVNTGLRGHRDSLRTDNGELRAANARLKAELGAKSAEKPSLVASEHLAWRVDQFCEAVRRIEGRLETAKLRLDLLGEQHAASHEQLSGRLDEFSKWAYLTGQRLDRDEDRLDRLEEVAERSDGLFAVLNNLKHVVRALSVPPAPAAGSCPGGAGPT
jgi:phage shock protein A